MSSSPPITSAPAARASSACSPSAKTHTLTFFPVPCGRFAASDDHVERLGSPRRTAMSTVSVNLARAPALTPATASSMVRVGTLDFLAPFFAGVSMRRARAGDLALGLGERARLLDAARPGAARLRRRVRPPASSAANQRSRAHERGPGLARARQGRRDARSARRIAIVANALGKTYRASRTPATRAALQARAARPTGRASSRGPRRRGSERALDPTSADRARSCDALPGPRLPDPPQPASRSQRTGRAARRCHASAASNFSRYGGGRREACARTRKFAQRRPTARARAENTSAPFRTDMTFKLARLSSSSPRGASFRLRGFRRRRQATPEFTSRPRHPGTPAVPPPSRALATEAAR